MLKISKYQVNQLLCFFVISLLIGNFALLFRGFWTPAFWFIPFLLKCLLLHYHLNLVHLATHRLLSKNLRLNSFLGNLAAIFGGLTLADFQATHIQHHRHLADSELDPDVSIAKHNFFWLPFQIWRHDWFFWERGLWKVKRAWVGYFIDRIAQICLVSFFFLEGKIWLWIFFWLIPIYLVGFLNGLFLFYFPHYTTAWERQKRAAGNLFFWEKTFLFIIDISRLYHQKHHDKMLENRNYFPVLSFFQDKAKNQWKPQLLANIWRYVDLNTEK